MKKSYQTQLTQVTEFLSETLNDFEKTVEQEEVFKFQFNYKDGTVKTGLVSVEENYTTTWNTSIVISIISSHLAPLKDITLRKKLDKFDLNKPLTFSKANKERLRSIVRNAVIHSRDYEEMLARKEILQKGKDSVKEQLADHGYDINSGSGVTKFDNSVYAFSKINSESVETKVTLNVENTLKLMEFLKTLENIK